MVYYNPMDTDISRTKKILATLGKHYPHDGKCFLHYDEPWQLLFATILSAQCTDNMVNKVTARLFAKLPEIKNFAECDLSLLEELVRPTGFYRTKASNLKKTAAALLCDYGGSLPSDINELTKLPGVGRKTANVVRGHIFGLPSIVVDTHVKRVSFRLGLTKEVDPVKIEFELMDVLPQTNWIAYNQQIISHGRKVCTSKKPKCGECELNKLCKGV